MSDPNVVTSQPVSSPANNFLPSAPPENVVVTQPLNMENMHITLNEGADIAEKYTHENTYSFMPTSAPADVVKYVNGDEPITELTRADALKHEEEERRRQNRNDFCCYVCADSCLDDDIFCWCMIWRCYCNCLGLICEGVSNCTDSCCEGCASCLSSCCNCGDQEGCCNGCCDGSQGGGGCCDDSQGGGGCCDGGGPDDTGCCDGGEGGGDCDCDCGGCFD